MQVKLDLVFKNGEFASPKKTFTWLFCLVHPGIDPNHSLHHFCLVSFCGGNVSTWPCTLPRTRWRSPPWVSRYLSGVPVRQTSLLSTSFLLPQLCVRKPCNSHQRRLEKYVLCCLISPSLERDLPDPKVSGVLPRGMALSEDRRAHAAQGPPGVPASCPQALGPQKLKQVTEMLLCFP